MDATLLKLKELEHKILSYLSTHTDSSPTTIEFKQKLDLIQKKIKQLEKTTENYNLIGFVPFVACLDCNLYLATEFIKQPTPQPLQILTSSMPEGAGFPFNPNVYRYYFPESSKIVSTGLYKESTLIFNQFNNIYHDDFIITDKDTAMSFSELLFDTANFSQYKNKPTQDIYNEYKDFIIDLNKTYLQELTPLSIVKKNNQLFLVLQKDKNFLYANYTFVLMFDYLLKRTKNIDIHYFEYKDLLYIATTPSKQIDILPEKKPEIKKTTKGETIEIDGVVYPIEHDIVFPRLSKSIDIKDNILSCLEYNSYLETVIIEKEVTVNNNEWDILTNNFLSYQDVWKQIGKMAEINDKTYTFVVKIINGETGEAIYVDAEGYDYARYVGHNLKDYNNWAIKLQPIVDARKKKAQEERDKKDAPKNFYNAEIKRQENCQEPKQTKRILKSNPLYKKVMANITAMAFEKEGFDGMTDSSTYWTEYATTKDEIQKGIDLINQNNLKVDYKGNGFYQIWLSRHMRRKFNYLQQIHFISICLNSQQTAALPESKEPEEQDIPEEQTPPSEEQEISNQPPIDEPSPDDEPSDDALPQVDSQGNVLQDCYLFDNLGRLELYLTKDTFKSLTQDQKDYLKRYFLNSPKGARISKSKDGINFKNRVRSILGDKFPDNVECTSLPQDMSAFKWKRKWKGTSAQGTNKIYTANNYLYVNFNFSDYIKVKNKPEFATCRKVLYLLFIWDKDSKSWKSKNTIDLIDKYDIQSIAQCLNTFIPNLEIDPNIYK